jgi:hypothetical protein
MTAWLGLFSSLAGLILLLVKQFLSESSASAAQQKAYVLDQAAFENLVNQALTKMRFQASQDSTQAKTVENQVDQSEQDRKNQS